MFNVSAPFFLHLQCRISHTRARRPAHRSQSSIPQNLTCLFFRGNKKNTAPPSLSRGGGGGRATTLQREQAPAALPSSPPREHLPLSLQRLHGQSAPRARGTVSGKAKEAAALMTSTLIHSRKAQMRRGGCGSGLRGDYLHSSILAPEVAGPKARRAWRGAPAIVVATPSLPHRGSEADA